MFYPFIHVEKEKRIISEISDGYKILEFWCKRCIKERKRKKSETYPSVVIVTMVYQKAAGIEVKFVPSTFFSA